MENSLNSRIQKQNKTKNYQTRSGKAAAYKTEWSQPDTMEDKKQFQIIAQNTKPEVLTHPMEPHPRMPWHLY